MNKLYKFLNYKLVYKCESISIGIAISPYSNCAIGIDQFMDIGATLLFAIP